MAVNVTERSSEPNQGQSTGDNPNRQELAPAIAVELDQARADAEMIRAYAEGVDALPVEVGELPAAVSRFLGADERELWPQLEGPGRHRLLAGLLTRRISSLHRRHQQALRQDICGRYVDLLYEVGHTRRAEVGDAVYEELRARMFAAKAEWETYRSAAPKRPSRYAA